MLKVHQRHPPDESRDGMDSNSPPWEDALVASFIILEQLCAIFWKTQSSIEIDFLIYCPLPLLRMVTFLSLVKPTDSCPTPSMWSWGPICIELFISPPPFKFPSKAKKSNVFLTCYAFLQKMALAVFCWLCIVLHHPLPPKLDLRWRHSFIANLNWIFWAQQIHIHRCTHQEAWFWNASNWIELRPKNCQQNICAIHYYILQLLLIPWRQ